MGGRGGDVSVSEGALLCVGWGVGICEIEASVSKFDPQSHLQIPGGLVLTGQLIQCPDVH